MRMRRQATWKTSSLRRLGFPFSSLFSMSGYQKVVQGATVLAYLHTIHIPHGNRSSAVMDPGSCSCSLSPLFFFVLFWVMGAQATLDGAGLLSPRRIVFLLLCPVYRLNGSILCSLHSRYLCPSCLLPITSYKSNYLKPVSSQALKHKTSRLVSAAAMAQVTPFWFVILHSAPQHCSVRPKPSTCLIDVGIWCAGAKAEAKSRAVIHRLHDFSLSTLFW